MTDERRDNQNSEVAEGADDTEFGMMTFIVPGQEPMSLDELKAHHEAEKAQRLEIIKEMQDDYNAPRPSKDAYPVTDENGRLI